MAKFFRKFSWKKIISIVLAVLLSIAAIAGISALVGYLKDDKKTIHPSFEVGGILPTTGEHDPDEHGAIYTEEAFSAKGLEVLMDFDSEVTYQVFYYDSLGNFAYASEVMDKGAEFYTPYGYKARLQVTPIWESNLTADEKEISWYEVSGYANQIEVRVDKEQGIAKSDYTTLTLESEMFSVKKDYQFQSNVGEMTPVIDDSGEERLNSGVACYYFENTSLCSSMYVISLPEDDSIPEEFQIYGYHIRCKDGTVYGYSSKESLVPGIKGYSMPTFEEPMFIPEGAEVYITGYFGVDLEYASDFVFGLY